MGGSIYPTLSTMGDSSRKEILSNCDPETSITLVSIVCQFVYIFLDYDLIDFCG